jgi:methylated-DNA-[protein]-cysteine S-methyltransferase
MQETAYYQSPIGVLEIKGSPRGIRSVKRVEGRVHIHPPSLPIIQMCVRQLDEYFKKEREYFHLTLDWSGAPDFNKAVWMEICKVEYGHTTTYSAIAEKLNNPKAVRAVGQANRNNPIAIIVPCHRVIAKNGDLQGYFYGLDIKRQLLELENPLSFAQQGTLF